MSSRLTVCQPWFTVGLCSKSSRAPHSSVGFEAYVIGGQYPGSTPACEASRWATSAISSLWAGVFPKCASTTARDTASISCAVDRQSSSCFAAATRAASSATSQAQRDWRRSGDELWLKRFPTGTRRITCAAKRMCLRRGGSGRRQPDSGRAERHCESQKHQPASPRHRNDPRGPVQGLVGERQSVLRHRHAHNPSPRDASADFRLASLNRGLAGRDGATGAAT